MIFETLFQFPDINQGVKTVAETSGSLLLDVRTRQEYVQGHIPGSQNIPLQSLDNILLSVQNKDTPLFVYCYSGGRSRQAAQQLRAMGYTNVKNLGGIAAYRGKVER